MRLFQIGRFLSPGEGDAPAATPNTPPADPKPDPRDAELADLRKYKAEREAETAKAAKAKKEADDAEALKRGEHEKLLAAEKATKAELEAKVAAYEAAEAKRMKETEARNLKRVEALPANIKALVPTKLSPTDLADWLDSVSAATGDSKPAPVVPGGPPSKGNDTLPAEIVAEARRKNMDPQDWAALVRKHQPTRWATLTKKEA